MYFSVLTNFKASLAISFFVHPPFPPSLRTCFCLDMFCNREECWKRKGCCVGIAHDVFLPSLCSYNHTRIYGLAPERKTTWRRSSSPLKKKMMTLNHPIISSINSLHRLHRLVCPPQEAIYSSVLLTQVCWNIWNVLWPSRSCSRLEGPGQIPLLLGKFSLIARSEPIDLSLLSTEYDKGV